jgi:hypothetical protein
VNAVIAGKRKSMIMPIEQHIIRNSVWECRAPTSPVMPAINALRPDDVSGFHAESVIFVFHKVFQAALLILSFDRPGGSLGARGAESPPCVIAERMRLRRET